MTFSFLTPQVNDRFEYYTLLDLDRPGYLAHTVDRSVCCRYYLCSVVAHSGAVRGGHFCSFVKLEKGNRWLKCDDERLGWVPESEATRERWGTGECRI